jgi:hypothetical protein
MKRRGCAPTLLTIACVLALPLGACDGCPARPREPVEIVLDVPERQALAYRVRGEARTITPRTETRAIEALVFVERGHQGQPILRIDESTPASPGVQGLGGASSSGDENVRLWFPTPDQALGGEPRIEQWTIANTGSTSTTIRPDLTITDTFTSPSASDDEIAVSIERRIDMGMIGESTQRLAARFDRRARRYTVVELAGHSDVDPTRDPSFAKMARGLGASLHMESSEQITLTYDAAASAARSAQLAEIAEAREEARRDYDEYVAAHPAEREVREALAEIGERQRHRPSPRLQFQLVADPARVWRAALAADAPVSLERFAEAVTFLYALRVEEHLPDEIVELIRPRIGRHHELDFFVVDHPDPRLVDEIARLAGDDRDPELAQRATRALTALRAPPTLETLRASGRDPQTFMTIGTPLVLGASDPRASVEILVEVLADPRSAPEVKQVCVQWLEAITRRALGDDVAAWRRFLEEHRSANFAQWMLGAARQDNPLLKQSALEALGGLEPSAEARALLLHELDHQLEIVRVAASGSLLRWGDPRGVRPLLDLLESPIAAWRGQGLSGLASLGDTTLGYDPEAPEIERARAAARWRAWAERLPPPPQ